MNPQRPSWCPNQKCVCLSTMHNSMICAGMPGDLGRLCFNFNTVGGDVFVYERVNTTDVQALRDLVDALDDQLIARGERGTE